ncbi:MAG TPA: AsmA-like C-terminal region-containing protein [Methylomirabilota bacterium]|nr:AsmA-like C-terminal region-containing protein [Methylomirabilota bacterium]
MPPARYHDRVRVLKGLGIVAAILAIAGGAALLVAHRYVQSEGFKQAVLLAARDALGADVRIRELRVSLLSGAELAGLQVTNPTGFPGDIFTADALVVRYRLLPLLRRRLEIREVSLDRPVLRLSRRESGDWNYQRIGPPPAAPGAPPAPEARTPPPGAVPAGLEVLVPRLSVDGGEVTILGERDRVLARVKNVALATSLIWGEPRGGSGALGGAGTARIEALEAGRRLVARDLTAPVRFSASGVRLAPITGELAKGALGGGLRLRFRPGFRFDATLEVKDADVGTLLQEAGNRAPVIRGQLQGQARFEGTGGLPSMTGAGHAEVIRGALTDIPVLATLATLLQVPALRDLAFDECRLEFSLANGVLQTPVLRVVSRDIQITGQGSVLLVPATLDHQLTLAVSPELFRRVPRDVRQAFTERADGFRTVAFRVWGPTDAPRTDLSERLLKGMAEGFLKRGLQKLFR